MGLPAKQPGYSIQEYYRIENDATEKHEFRDGEILAMSGSCAPHAKIAMNTGACLWNRIEGQTLVALHSAAICVYVLSDSNEPRYPNVSVICGPIQYDPDDKAGHTILNPRVIIEILSPSTEAYDRGGRVRGLSRYSFFS